MRTLLLCLALAASAIVFLPGASAAPVSVCARAVEPACPGFVCVIHPTIALIENPTCVLVTAQSPKVCTELDFQTCGPNLVCVIDGSRLVCVPDPCYTTDCF